MKVLYHSSIRTAIPAMDVLGVCQCYYVLLPGGRRVLIGVHELDIVKGELA